MTEPMALTKGKALAQYMFGADKADAYLTLTDREAWEFLAWYRTQLHDPSRFDNEMRSARALNDPWPVLAGMAIIGFQVAKAQFQEMH